MSPRGRMTMQNGQPATSAFCCDCKARDATLYFCPNCEVSFCDACWPKPAPHQNSNGRNHVKTDPFGWFKIREILEPPIDERTLEKLHIKDESTKWFGVKRSGKGKLKFEDTGRYASLMTESGAVGAGLRYPNLVGFVGDTNAGKSTLIKALVAIGASKDQLGADDFPSPVVGSVKHENNATSEGVHLYADPEKFSHQYPLLYADCEGLNAGEQIPFALSSMRNKIHSSSDSIHATKKIVKRSIQEMPFVTNLPRMSKDIAWAAMNDNSSRRDFAVRNLYPRILYTFSDVVVFVQKNPKQTHVTLELLIEWANACLEKSINQPVLPHAIVVLNAVDVGPNYNLQDAEQEKQRWDINQTTQNVLRSGEVVFEKEPFFIKYTRAWREIGHPVDGIMDLLDCYYSSISVIRIPMKSPKTYSMINDQISKLRRVIIENCNHAREKKRAARKLCSVDQLDEYLVAGFEHFTKDLVHPFDFIKVSIRNDPIPLDFADHIATLATAVQKRLSQPGQKLFLGLSGIVASCILLEIVRHNRKGSVDEYFAHHYKQICEVALTRYCDLHWPCEFVSRKGLRCACAKTSHVKQHQDANGKVIGSGTYTSYFSPEKVNKIWVQDVKARLKEFEIKLGEIRDNAISNDHPEVVDMATLHRKQLKHFYAHVGAKEHYFNHATCLCCLTGVPQYPLKCGHVLCLHCIKNYGKLVEDYAISMERCPLHSDENLEAQSSLIRLKPDHAGVRVLCLDGGGIRGITELEVLRAIEEYVNKGAPQQIPVQRFFDLVVGTSTGGIIALGLVAKQWTVQQCTDKFLDLANEAFTQRELSTVPILKELTTLTHRSEYKTRPLHRALRKSLGNEILFGGKHDDVSSYDTKVGVTSTSRTAVDALLIANYNRQEDSEPTYQLEFAADPAESMEFWEAAAATSAAPPFFKAFACKTTGRVYLDGAIHHNNPVMIANHERQLLWPDTAKKHPDLFLSIGTGQDARKVERELQKIPESTQDQRKDGQIPKVPETAHARLERESRASKSIVGIFSVLFNRLDNILDTELRWREFYNQTVGDIWSTSEAGRYIRLNPDLGYEPPKLDAKQKMNDLRQDVIKRLKIGPQLAQVHEIAHRLVASSFYFQKIGKVVEHRESIYRFNGKIRCKFYNTTDDIRTLGNFFMRQQIHGFQPCFVVKIQHSSREERKIEITASLIEQMCSKAYFDMNAPEIELENAETPLLIFLRLRDDGVANGKPTKVGDFPISGFPRTLVREDEDIANMLHEREAEIRRRQTIKSNRRGESMDQGRQIFLKSFMTGSAIPEEAISVPGTANGEGEPHPPPYFGSPDSASVVGSLANSSLTDEGKSQPGSSRMNVSYRVQRNLSAAKSQTQRESPSTKVGPTGEQRRSSTSPEASNARGQGTTKSCRFTHDAFQPSYTASSETTPSRGDASVPPPIPYRTPEYVIALWAFSAQRAGDLSFPAGAQIMVLGKDDVDWWQGEYQGSEGIFPSNYVRAQGR